MFGLDLDLLSLSAPDLIEKFRKDIEKEVGEPVSVFSLYHKCDSGQIEIKTPNKKKIIKGRTLSFMIRKGLKMKLKKNVDFTTIELIHDPDKNMIVMHTKEGIETQTL